MKQLFFVLVFLVFAQNTFAQNKMTPDLLLQMGRVSAVGITADNNFVIYRVSTPDISANKLNSSYYKIPISGGKSEEIKEFESLIKDKNISPNGNYKLFSENVKVEKVSGADYYPNLAKSDAQIYNGLDYRHWDTWHDGSYNHLFYQETNPKATPFDLLKNEAVHCPQQPFGGDEDFIWHPSSTKIIYVAKKKNGTAYATSTNTDLYSFDISTKQTTNLTASNLGYDTQPAFSPNGDLTWLQMKREGYEADKNDIIVRFKKIDYNMTANWDGTVSSFSWSPDGKKIYFIAPINGTEQLFEVNFPGVTRKAIQVEQVTNGDFDITGIVGFNGDKNIILTRQDMNHPTEIFCYNLKKATWQDLTQVNKKQIDALKLSKTERRIVKTTDGKEMLVWVIYPPDFNPNKKYPTLLYCQGGPQGALTQFYSYRWNFQLMAAQGYIVLAPNRRGMPGHGVSWNEEISKDWGGQAMRDYLATVDDFKKEPFVDPSRIGAVGASYGGYSVFQLAGIHQKRFKTFISHCGVFNLESMYGTTEEVFFTNWDLGGPYWDMENKEAQKSYTNFNPKNLVQNWDTPILIYQGGKDFRVPIGQGQEAFQAAQLRGIPSRFIYFENENHWIMKPQNGLVWQHEFFKWLQETL
jgi:dipeptidyl aminopeptidase/acylaminoacyl peptidase